MQRRARKKIFVGFLVLAAFFAPFGYGLGLLFFILSIVCTAGISLLVWIPLALLVGSITFKLIDKFIKKEEAVEVESQKPALTKEQLALINYVHRARNSGMSDEKIVSFLKSVGWTEGEIKKIFSNYQQQQLGN